MRETLRVLQIAVTCGFVALAGAALWQWLRVRSRSHGYLALGLGFLALVVILDLAGSILDGPDRTLANLTVSAFIASGFALLLLRHSFLPLSRRTLTFAAVAMAAVAINLLVAGLPLEDRATNTLYQSLSLVAALVAWTLCVSEPIFRFWVASQGRPTVQRARLRALSIAYGAIVVLLFISVFGNSGVHPGLAVAVEMGGLLLVPLLFVSFAPPRWLRRVWREREEEALRAAQEFAGYAPDQETLADRALGRGLRMVGADEGFLATADGRVLAAAGISSVAAGEAAAAWRNRPGLIRVERWRHAIVSPLPMGASNGMLAVISGPFTPLFGSDEVARLADYAQVVAVGLDRVRLVEALHQETSRYEALLQAVSDLGQGFIITEAGRCIYANAAYCRMSGYSLDELRSLPSLLDLGLPEESAEVAERLRQRMAGGHVTDHYTAGLVCKDGSIKLMEAAVKLLHTDSGPQIVSIVRDVTERKRAEVELERRTAAIQLLQQVAVAANEATRTEEVLRVALDAICRYAGWPVGHVYLADPTGRRLESSRIWHMEDPVAFEAFRDETEATDLEMGRGLPGRILELGEPLWVTDLSRDEYFSRKTGAVASGLRSAFAFPILVGAEVVGVLEFFSTKLAEPDQALLDLASNLGAQLGRVVERKRIETFRDEFISNAAHELRTPLAAVVGFASLLAERREGMSAEHVEIAIDALNRQGKRLQALVNNLLDFTRFQQGRHDVDLRPLTVEEAVAEALNTVPPPDTKSVAVEALEGAVVMANPFHLDQILTNLLTNAYKYGGDAITVVARSEDDSVLIQVCDDGPGISSDLAAHLFDPFTRGEDAQAVEGSGLGLAIVRMLTRAQGGDVWYEPGGSGARFTVRLPRAS